MATPSTSKPIRARTGAGSKGSAHNAALGGATGTSPRHAHWPGSMAPKVAHPAARSRASSTAPPHPRRSDHRLESPPSAPERNATATIRAPTPRCATPPNPGAAATRDPLPPTRPAPRSKPSRPPRRIRPASADPVPPSPRSKPPPRTAPPRTPAPAAAPAPACLRPPEPPPPDPAGSPLPPPAPRQPHPTAPPKALRRRLQRPPVTVQALFRVRRPSRRQRSAELPRQRGVHTREDPVVLYPLPPRSLQPQPTLGIPKQNVVVENGIPNSQGG